MTDNSPETADSETEDAAVDSAQSSAREPPSYHPPAQERFDWRGWVLVGIVVFSFLVVPGAILYLPYAQDLIAAWGISWTQAYLALPMIPALLLGATAIWAAVSSRSLSD